MCLRRAWRWPACRCNRVADWQRTLRDAVFDRIVSLVDEEESQHRELARLVEELMGNLASPMSPDQLTTYIEQMQSFDRMRQRVVFLVDVMKAMEASSEPQHTGSALVLTDLAGNAPLQSEGQWLNSMLPPCEAR